MCHEASAVSMIESLGVGKGTVVFDDLEHADAIFVIGQNPGTNHPRMLEPLREAVKRGAQVICINPLKERGLERFQHPQHPIEMLLNGSEPTNTAYFRPALGGDMAVMRGMVKFLLQWEREAQVNGDEPVFDHEFIAEHTSGMGTYLGKSTPPAGSTSSSSRACPWLTSNSPPACTPGQAGDHVLGDGLDPAHALGADAAGSHQPDAAARQRRPSGRGAVAGAWSQ